MRSAREATLSAMSAQQNAMANSSPERRATTAAGADVQLQPLGNGSQHQVAIGVAKHVVDLLETIETDDQERNLAMFGLDAGDHCGEPGVERVAIGEPGQRIVLGKIPDLFRLALAHRDVAQDRAILIALGTLPTGKAGLHRKHFTIAAPAVELDDGAGRAGRRTR